MFMISRDRFILSFNLSLQQKTSKIKIFKYTKRSRKVPGWKDSRCNLVVWPYRAGRGLCRPPWPCTGRSRHRWWMDILLKQFGQTLLSSNTAGYWFASWAKALSFGFWLWNRYGFLLGVIVVKQRNSYFDFCHNIWIKPYHFQPNIVQIKQNLFKVKALR